MIFAIKTYQIQWGINMYSSGIMGRYEPSIMGFSQNAGFALELQLKDDVQCSVQPSDFGRLHFWGKSKSSYGILRQASTTQLLRRLKPRSHFHQMGPRWVKLGLIGNVQELLGLWVKAEVFFVVLNLLMIFSWNEAKSSLRVGSEEQPSCST